MPFIQIRSGHRAIIHNTRNSQWQYVHATIFPPLTVNSRKAHRVRCTRYFEKLSLSNPSGKRLAGSNELRVQRFAAQLSGARRPVGGTTKTDPIAPPALPSAPRATRSTIGHDLRKRFNDQRSRPVVLGRARRELVEMHDGQGVLRPFVGRRRSRRRTRFFRPRVMVGDPAWSGGQWLTRSVAGLSVVVDQIDLIGPPGARNKSRRSRQE